MNVPEMAHRAEAARARAVDDLDRARERQHQLADLAHAAEGTSSEAKAADALAAARAHVAAREAWLVWIERGY